MTALDITLDPPIFIIGYMHSGTTLLQQILGCSSEVFISAGETRHFSNLQVTCQQYPNLDDPDQRRGYLLYLLRVISKGYATVNFREGFAAEYQDVSHLGISDAEFSSLLEKSQGITGYNDLFVAAYDFMATRAGKKRWLDKLPGYVTQWGQMSSAVPQAMFVELVRDPRDILASKKKRVSRGGGFDPIWDTLGWRADVRAGDAASARHPQQILRVRYEDLVTDPQQTVQRICDFLNIAYQAEMLDVGWINTTTGDAAAPNQGINASAVGKWEKQLSQGDIVGSQWIAAKELAANHYKLLAVSAMSTFSLPFTLARSGIEFFIRLYNRWRQGGFGYLLNVLSNYQKRFKASSRKT